MEHALLDILHSARVDVGNDILNHGVQNIGHPMAVS